MLTQAGSPQALPPLDTLTDEQVVERVVAGDVALFEILMRRNNTRVYRVIRSLLRDESEVEDAMQSTYLLAYAKLKSFRGAARFSTWLSQIAFNEAAGRLRVVRRDEGARLSLVEEPPMPSPETNASGRELAAYLEHAIDTLPEMYRVVFMMRDVEGMSTAETAMALELTEDAVKTRLFRARGAVRDELGRLVGNALPEAFGFQAPRCNRVVANVMRQLTGG
jgi:RNA polymerase sigma-70 factor (ECF subfamily)